MDQRVLWFYTPVALLAPYGATRKHPISMILAQLHEGATARCPGIGRMPGRDWIDF